MAIDTGDMRYWNRGSPEFPYQENRAADTPGVPDTGSMTWWSKGSPLPPQSPKLTATDTGTGVDTSTLSTGATVINVTDSGTGSDASTLHASYSQTDTSSSVDSSASYRAGTDTGTGTDSSTVRIPVSASDTGTATDASTEAAAYSLSDTGTATDSASLDKSVTVDDTGTADDESFVAAAYSSEDTGTGTESSSFGESFFVADSGTGSEISIVAAFDARTESGTGTEVATVTARITATQTGTGVDDAEVNGQRFITRTDTGHGTEAKTLHVSHSRTDSGTCVDKGFFPVSASDTGSGADSSFLHANIGQRASTGAFVTRQYNNAFAQVLAPVPTFPQTQSITLAQGAAAGNKLVLTMAHNANTDCIDVVSSAGLTWHILPQVHNAQQTLVVAYADIPSDLSAGYVITIHYATLCTRQSYILDELTGVVPGGPAEFAMVPGLTFPVTTGLSSISPGNNDMVLGHFSYATIFTAIPSQFTPGAGYHMDVVQPGVSFGTTGPTDITEYKNGPGAKIEGKIAYAGSANWWIAGYTIWDGVPASVALDDGSGDDSSVLDTHPIPPPVPPTQGFVVLRGRMTIRAGVGVLS